jgi:hypothetical protein
VSSAWDGQRPSLQYLNHVDRVRRDPNVKLLESRFQALLETLEELAMTRFVGHVHEEAGQIIVVRNTTLLPSAPQRLCFPGSRAELGSQFRKRLDEQRLWHGAPSLNSNGTRTS